MKRCVIFCAAEFDGLIEPLQGGDLIIAADGGLRHTRLLGVEPQVILGDFDSLEYVPMGANVFPVEKDDTDSMLAVRRGLAADCGFFLIYGGMDGPRLDHTVANFQTIQFLTDRGAAGILVGRDYLAAVVKNGTMSFPEGLTGGVSVFCMGADAKGVSIEGLYYTVDGIVMTSGFPLGVSNHFTGKAARITVSEGSLLVLWERQAGLPEIANGTV